MPFKKPLPNGPAGQADHIDNRELAIESAVEAWTQVLELATNSPETAVKGVRGEIGRAIRDLVCAWSSHPKHRRAERVELAAALKQLQSDRHTSTRSCPDSRSDKAVVSNINEKLSGAAPVTLCDAQWIIAAVTRSWPLRLTLFGDPCQTVQAQASLNFASAFLVALVDNNTTGLSAQARDQIAKILAQPAASPGKKTPADNWIFPLSTNADSTDALSIVKRAATSMSALIVSSTDSIFIEPDPVDSINNFCEMARLFTNPEQSGILVFVVDANFLRNRDLRSARRNIFNTYTLLAALASFGITGALNQDIDFLEKNHDRLHYWSEFTKRCCIILKNFAITRGKNMERVFGAELDLEIQKRFNTKEQYFSDLDEESIVPVLDPAHLLPISLPKWVKNKKISKPKGQKEENFHRWSVLIQENTQNSKPIVEYYVIPEQNIYSKIPNGHSLKSGRRSERKFISGGAAYLTKCTPPPDPEITAAYDNAQMTAFWAALGRLGRISPNSPKGRRCSTAILSLRDAGFEVLPVDIAMTLLTDTTVR